MTGVKVTDREIILRFHQAEEEYGRKAYRLSELATGIDLTPQHLKKRLDELEADGFIECVYPIDRIRLYKIRNVSVYL